MKRIYIILALMGHLALSHAVNHFVARDFGAVGDGRHIDSPLPSSRPAATVEARWC